MTCLGGMLTQLCKIIMAGQGQFNSVGIFTCCYYIITSQVVGAHLTPCNEIDIN